MTDTGNHGRISGYPALRPEAAFCNQQMVVPCKKREIKATILMSKQCPATVNAMTAALI
jgi:hypothetical protein